MPSILILDADQRSALAATRALGEAGYAVHTGDTGPSALASCSRWSRGHLNYPDPSDDKDRAIDAIARYCENTNIDFLFPMTDVSTHLVQSAAGGSLPKTPCPPPEIYEAASDKGELMQTAAAAGVAIPQTHFVAAGERLESLPDGFDFPVVLKPTRSRVPVDSGYLHTQVAIARDAKHFGQLQDEHRWFREHPWLLQSFIEGVGQGVFSLYANGEPLAWFAHRRIREKPPSGGVSVLSASAPLEPRLRESAETLLNAMKWHGPAMVEYRVAADGTPYLMEINARFWGSLQLAISAGVNFPLLAAQVCQSTAQPLAEPYSLGVYNRWLLGDLDNLYLTLKSRDYGLQRKLGALLRFALPWRPGLRYEVFRPRDLAPFRYELARYFGFGK